MSHDHTTTHAGDDGEQIVPAPPLADPGAQDGVGEHVLQGFGHDGVRRMDGEFGELEPEIGRTDPEAAGPEADDASTHQA